MQSEPKAVEGKMTYKEAQESVAEYFQGDPARFFTNIGTPVNSNNIESLV